MTDARRGIDISYRYILICSLSSDSCPLTSDIYHLISFSPPIYGCSTLGTAIEPPCCW